MDTVLGEQINTDTALGGLLGKYNFGHIQYAQIIIRNITVLLLFIIIFFIIYLKCTNVQISTKKF